MYKLVWLFRLQFYSSDYRKNIAEIIEIYLKLKNLEASGFNLRFFIFIFIFNNLNRLTFKNLQ